MSPANDLQRVVMIQKLKADAVGGYVEAHEDVPDSVIEAMEEGGVETYELYVQDDVAVSIMDVEDLTEFEEVYGDDSRNQAWEERVGRFKRSGVDPDDMEMPAMERIWSLNEAQADE